MGIGKASAPRCTRKLCSLVPYRCSARSLKVAGDVNYGSSVECEGDICVLGRLSGKARAGIRGDRRAVIRAQRIDSDQVEIAGVKTNRRLQLDQATLVVCSSDGFLELKPQQEAGALPPARLGGNSALQVEQIYLPAAKPQKKGGLRKGQKRRKVSLEALRNSSPPARAALFTGAYITAIGLALLLAPLHTFTLLFDQRSIAPSWIRVGGTLCCLFGTYYLGAAHGDITSRNLDSFYQSTVYGRLFLFCVFSLLVLLRKAQAQLMVLAAINLFGAASMHLALRRQ